MNEFVLAYWWVAATQAAIAMWLMRRDIRSRPLLMLPVPLILALAWPLVGIVGLALLVIACFQKDTE